MFAYVCLSRKIMLMLRTGSISAVFARVCFAQRGVGAWPIISFRLHTSFALRKSIILCNFQKHIKPLQSEILRSQRLDRVQVISYPGTLTQIERGQEGVEGGLKPPPCQVEPLSNSALSSKLHNSAFRRNELTQLGCVQFRAGNHQQNLTITETILLH